MDFIYFALFIGGFIIFFKFPEIFAILFVISFILLFLIAGVNSINSNELVNIIIGVGCIAIGIGVIRAFLEDIKRMKK